MTKDKELIEILETIEQGYAAEKQAKEAEDDLMAEIYKLEAEESMREGEKALKEAVRRAKEAKLYKDREGIGNALYMSENYEKEIKEAARKYLRKTGKFDKHYFYTRKFKTNNKVFIYRWTVYDEDGVGYIYVGQSFNPVKRWLDELKESKAKRSRNYDARRSVILRNICEGDFDKFLLYGNQEILEETTDEKANDREAYWIYQTAKVAEIAGLWPLNKEVWAE